MKNTALKLLFLANYILTVFYMSWHVKEVQPGIESKVPLLIATLMLIDITYISSCNLRENKVISLFCGLLALESWYLLLSFREGMVERFIFMAFGPIIWYVSMKFILMFLFQGSGYQLRKITDTVFSVTCLGSLIGIGISDRVFAGLCGIQFLAYCLSFLLIVIYHWKRIAFVLKSERKCILFSAAVIAILFCVYYYFTIGMKNHISNFGIYLPALLLFMSIHGIVLKEHSSYPLSTVFNKKQTALIICSSVMTLGLITLFMGGGYKELLAMINALFAFIYTCNIILGLNLKQGKSQIIRDSKYNEALRQLQREELLKTEFANFLHDDVLQNLLSIKNMITKAYRPEIQDMIMETFDSLNIKIREQMQNYHPVILKNLTARENYQNLIEAVSQSFPRRNISVVFDCPDGLFLVEPYNVLIYRILKELLTNVFKHSDGSRAWVALTQENGVIKLCVSDDGTANADCLLTADGAEHKGIASIAGQVDSMEGYMSISDSVPHGVCVQITIPMKGDVSYQYFVS